MKWLPTHLRRQVHLSSYMFKIIKGPYNFINKFDYIIYGGSRDGNNRGGGGINENSPRKWPKTHSQKLFISLFRIMSSVKKERDKAID